MLDHPLQPESGDPMKGRPGSPLLWCLLFFSLAVSGCVSTLVYNHADWLLTRQLDGYFDLSRSQKTFVSARLHTILDHHRHEALPKYEETLQQVTQRIQRGLSGDDLDWAFTQYEQLRTDLFARFVQDGAEFVHGVEERQIARVRKALEQQLAKEEEAGREGLEARLAKRTDRMLALVKEWLGSLTRQQEREVIQRATAFPDTWPVMYVHQQQRNAQLLAVLESRNQKDVSIKLYDWLVNQERSDDPSFLEATSQLKQHLRQLLLALDRIATPEQRRHVLAKLHHLEHTIQRLTRT
jgi:hypothetical protein